MKELIKLTIAFCLFSFYGFGQNLYASLVDVNERWAFENDYPSFVHDASSEYNPIQRHLFLVHETLSKRQVDHLSLAQQNSRSKLLAALKLYAERGQFPNNIRFKVRRPVFIGPNGNYCAVGHLIKTSGQDHLAKKISREMNYHYLLDMVDEELNQWVLESGFSAEELAWIQPGYPPTSVATKMKDGFNGPVNVIMPDANGEILAAGVFDSAGVGNALSISRWKNGFAGFDWINFSTTGLRYQVFDLEPFNGGIVAAGNIYQADTVFVGSGVAFWDGSNWSGMGTMYIGALPNEVYDIEVYNGELYAGGFFRSSPLSSNFFANLAKWNGNDWESLPASPQGLVHALEVHQGELIIAGTFNSIDTVSYDHIAAYDGSVFKQVGSGIPTVVYALESHGDTLFAGGDFLSHSLQDTFGFGYYANNQWTKVHTPEIDLSSWGQSIKCMEMTPYGLFVGGDIRYTPMIGTYGKNLLRYNSTSLSPYAVLDSTVNSLLYHNGLLYAGGMFTHGFGGFTPSDPLNHIAYYDLVQQFSIEDPVRTIKADVYPNPAVDAFVMDIHEQINIRGISIYDLAGKEIAFEYEKESQSRIKFKTNKIARGVYIIGIKTDRITLEKKVVLGQ